MAKLLIIVALAVAVLGGGTWYATHREAPAAEFKTAPVTRQDLSASIGATGTVEPEEAIDVGAQVNGQIVAFGPDKDRPGKTITFCSNVDAGALLAKIDDRTYQTELEKAKGGVASARAAVAKAEADQGQMQAKLFQANADWTRAQQLGGTSGVSQSELDQYKANFLIAQANVADSKAAIDQAKTALEQAGSDLRQAQQNVDYCTINSPVSGTIIARRMNVGQMIISSMTAPSLFLIAKDMRRMTVWAAVNETDRGAIHAGQAVTFTVDALPGQMFHGTVDLPRYDANSTQNVVTYPVEIAVDNSDRRLIPYWTANVQFQLDPRRQVQVVPNGALRWTPQDDQVAAGSDAQPAVAAGRPSTGPVNDGLHDRGTVWVQAGRGKVRPVRVRVGVTDGAVTEVAGIDGQPLPDETAVVTAAIDPNDGNGGDSAGNPFVPQWGKKKK